MGFVFGRFARLWPFKLVGATLGITLFFVAYFHVLNHPQYPVTVMPLTAIDHALPFSPIWLLPYVSLWFYVTLPPFLMTNGRQLSLYAVAAALLSVLGLVAFYFWPTTVPVADIDWNRHPSVAFLKSVDASGNACPSLHVAFAVFTAIWFDRLLNESGTTVVGRMLNVLWAVAIIISTVGTKQHVVWDVVGGVGLGAVVAWIHLAGVRVIFADRRS